MSDSFSTLWTVAHRSPPSTGLSRQEHCSELPCPPPGDLPHPGIKPTSPALAGGVSNTEPPGTPELGILPFYLDFTGGSAGKESACKAGDLGSDPWAGKNPWRRDRRPTPVCRPGEISGLYSPWDDMCYKYFFLLCQLVTF